MGIVTAAMTGGFDIQGGSNAYAVLSVGSQSRLYQINLATGAATLVGSVGSNLTLVDGLAIAPVKTPFDFDADGKTDLSVFRPSNGTWYLQQSANGFGGTAFGTSGDLIAPADYDGDGKADRAFSVRQRERGVCSAARRASRSYSSAQTATSPRRMPTCRNLRRSNKKAVFCLIYQASDGFSSA